MFGHVWSEAPMWADGCDVTFNCKAPQIIKKKKGIVYKNMEHVLKAHESIHIFPAIQRKALSMLGIDAGVRACSILTLAYFKMISARSSAISFSMSFFMSISGVRR